MIIPQLGDGRALGELGFDFMSILNPFSALMPKGDDKKEEKKEEKKDLSALMPTICPPGMSPNPQWTALPAEAKGQAAAAGVQACLEAPKVKVKLGCKITVGSRKFKCDQGEFDRARRYAQGPLRRPGPGLRRPRVVTFHIGKETMTFRPWPSRPAMMPGLPPGTTPGAPGQPCPPGTTPMVDSSNQPICVPTSALGPGGGAAAPGAGPSYADRGGHRRRRRRGRGRGRRERLRGLGAAPALTSVSPLLGGALFVLLGGALVLAARSA